MELNRVLSYYSKVSSKEIALMTGLSPSDVSNRKSRHKDFPTDRNASGAPAYWYGEVLKWAYAHGITIDGRKVSRNDIIRLREDYSKCLSIGIFGSVCERKRDACLFLKNSELMRQGLCLLAYNQIEIPIRITVAEGEEKFRLCMNLEESRTEYIADRNKIKEFLKKKDNEAAIRREEELQKCKDVLQKDYLNVDAMKKFLELSDPENQSVRRYLNKDVTILEDSFLDQMKEIQEFLFGMHFDREKIGHLERFFSLEIYASPAALSLEIMELTDKMEILIYDDPSHDFARDIVMFTVNRDNMKEVVKAVRKLSRNLMNEVIYTYYYTDRIIPDEDYEAVEKKVCDNEITILQKEIEKEFSEDDIVDSSIGVLEPKKRFAVLPLLSVKESQRMENRYKEKLKQLIVDSYRSRISIWGMQKFLEGVSREEAIEFLNIIFETILFEGEQDNLIEKVSVEMIGQSGNEKSQRSIFKQTTHNRVGSKEPEFSDKVYSLRHKEWDMIRKKFRSFKTDDYDNWQQYLIQHAYYCFDKVFQWCTGIGRGNHPAEDVRAVTMEAYDNIFADVLYDKLKDYAEPKNYTYSEIAMLSPTYIALMKRNNITSDSWNYVQALSGKIYYLRVISESGFLYLNCNNEDEMLRYCLGYGWLCCAIVDVYSDVICATPKKTEDDAEDDCLNRAIELARAHFYKEFNQKDDEKNEAGRQAELDDAIGNARVQYFNQNKGGE